MRAGDFFGEMALLEKQPRSATVRAVGEAYILTLDKKTFLRRVHADPSLAYRLLQTMSSRIRGLDNELLRLKAAAAPALVDPAILAQPPPAPQPRLPSSTL
jgi:CRP-like cAMP-binding protein